MPGFSLIARAAAVGFPIVALDRPCYGETTPLESGSETILTSAERLDAIIAGLVGPAPEVDAALRPDTGHCADLHRDGAAFQDEQLAFARRCAGVAAR